MGDIRADLEADLKIAEADIAAAKLLKHETSKEYDRLCDVRRDIVVQILKLDLTIGSKWNMIVKDGYYNTKRNATCQIVYVDETHIVYLRDGTIPHRMGIVEFQQRAKRKDG